MYELEVLAPVISMVKLTQAVGHIAWVCNSSMLNFIPVSFCSSLFLGLWLGLGLGLGSVIGLRLGFRVRVRVRDR